MMRGQARSIKQARPWLKVLHRISIRPPQDRPPRMVVGCVTGPHQARVRAASQACIKLVCGRRWCRGSVGQRVAGIVRSAFDVECDGVAAPGPYARLNLPNRVKQYPPTLARHPQQCEFKVPWVELCDRSWLKGMRKVQRRSLESLLKAFDDSILVGKGGRPQRIRMPVAMNEPRTWPYAQVLEFAGCINRGKSSGLPDCQLALLGS